MGLGRRVSRRSERIDDDDVLIEDGNRMPSGREMYMRLELIKSVRDGIIDLAEERYDNTQGWILRLAHQGVMGDVGKFASEFFVSADIDGMMYPVDYRHGNRDGRVSGWNYVAFSDEHLRVDHVYEYNPETDEFEKKWHEAEGAAGPRFTGRWGRSWWRRHSTRLLGLGWICCCVLRVITGTLMRRGIGIRGTRW